MLFRSLRHLPLLPTPTCFYLPLPTSYLPLPASCLPPTCSCLPPTYIWTVDGNSAWPTRELRSARPLEPGCKVSVPSPGPHGTPSWGGECGVLLSNLLVNLLIVWNRSLVNDLFYLDIASTTHCLPIFTDFSDFIGRLYFEEVSQAAEAADSGAVRQVAVPPRFQNSSWNPFCWNCGRRYVLQRQMLPSFRRRSGFLDVVRLVPSEASDHC